MGIQDSIEDAFKLVEECAGEGEVRYGDTAYPQVAYRIRRYQAMTASGLPVPGLHRLEGSIDVAALPEAERLVNRDLMLDLEDGRSLRLTLASAEGRVLAEGHGPSRCTCC
jgi:hypothetical protein